METGRGTVRCRFCGHENPAGNRFCGMCARALPEVSAPSKPIASPPPPPAQQQEQAIPVAAPKPSLVSANPAPPAVAPPPAKPAPPTPAVTVGSSALHPPSTPPPPQPKPTRRAHPSKDLTYLLEDEEERPKSRIWIGIVLMFLSLFGFFLWQTGGLGAFLKWFQGGRPQVTENQTPDTSTNVPSTGSSPNTSSPPASSAPATPANPSPSSSGTPPENTKPEASPPAKQDAKPETTPEPKSVEEKPKTDPTPSSPPAEAPKAEAKPAPPAVKAHAKPALPPPVATNPQTECDRRLAFLRAGDARGEAGATAQLGTMYYEGRCVARDLPTAYRFYARALHRDPNNAQIADTIASIWKQMSPAERQLATKPQQ